ncbi:MAG TPA: hypothetical protein VN132_14750 [Bdellovibrio sp.]|nr:hypothetical protein [Bdellovibrio sp.]
MKYFLMLLSLFSVEFALAREIPEVHSEKMHIAAFRGEGGGWNPSIKRCYRALGVLSQYISFNNEKGFISFTGECTEDGFDKEWPKNLFFASIMKPRVRTNLPKGQYSSQIFCLNSQSMAQVASEISTEKINIVLSADTSETCDDQYLSPVRFDIYIE